MLALTKKSILDKNFIKAIGAGGCASALTTLIVMCLFATLITKEVIGVDGVWFSVGVCSLSSFVGGIVTARINRGGAFWSVFITAIGYFALLFLISVILFQGLTSGVGRGLISVTVGSVASLFLSASEKMGKKRKRYRR